MAAPSPWPGSVQPAPGPAPAPEPTPAPARYSPQYAPATPVPTSAPGAGQFPYPQQPPQPAPSRSVSRAEPIPGTSLGVLYIGVPARASGVGIGSMVAGIASVLVSFLVGCFGLLGAADGWGAAVAGAFTVLAVLLGLGGVGLGVAGMRQVRRSAGAVSGKGFAITGISCGGIGVTIALLGLLVALVATAGA